MFCYDGKIFNKKKLIDKSYACSNTNYLTNITNHERDNIILKLFPKRNYYFNI